MNVVAAVFADFVETFLGGPSHLRTELGGQTIIGRTLLRLMRVDGLSGRCLFVRQRDQAIAESMLQKLDLADSIDVLPLDNGNRRRRALLGTARKWNMEAWRGSPLGTTWFDEYVEPLCVAQVLDHYDCEGVLCLDGHQPLLDVDIAMSMLDRYREYAGEENMVFTQAPPGLAGIILGRDSTRQLLAQDIPVGLLLSYRPELARIDPINQPACVHIDPTVAQTAMRLTADTRRSRELLSAALAELGDEPTTTALCDWYRQPGHDRAGSLPVEVELELTTADPLPQTKLRPRGERVPPRQLADYAAVSHLATELARYDDRFIILGGHGDPLAHPRFPEICQQIQAAGVCGLAVVTPLVELSDENLQALLTHKVDLVQVRLDAHNPQTYRQIHGEDSFEQVRANIERIEQLRRERLQAQPIMICSLVRCAATIQEIESFYDYWIREIGWAAIEGFNDYCGTLPADSLLPAEPPIRRPCLRLDQRMMLLADGSAVLCSQDYRGEWKVGYWATDGLADIWMGKALSQARAAHSQLNLAVYPVCQRCREWFRP